MMLPLPLAGLRVLDLSTGAAGAHATRTLGDLGAEVIRIDAPGATAVADEDVGPDKYSCGIDLGKTAGRDLCLRIVGKCEIVVEDRTVEIASLGLDYEALQAANAEVIVVSIANDAADAGAAGLAGVAAAGAALAALFHHRGSGEGQHVVVSAAATIAALAGDEVVAASMPGALTAPEPEVASSTGQTSGHPRLTEAVATRDGVRDMGAVPYGFSETPTSVRLPPPRPGEHNDYVLLDLLGLSENEVEALGVVGVI